MPYALRSGVCEHCREPFSRKSSGKDLMKFCSKKCANTYSNLARGRQAVARKCPKCSGPIGRNTSTTCVKCYRLDQSSQIGDQTLGDLKATYSLSEYHAKVRGHSRSSYTGPMICKVCRYSLHVDICHIRAVADFPLETKLCVVNHPDNLVALCKNHHWELDNGHLVGYTELTIPC